MYMLYCGHIWSEIFCDDDDDMLTGNDLCMTGQDEYKLYCQYWISLGPGPRHIL